MKSTLRTTREVIFDNRSKRKAIIYSSMNLIGNNAHVRDYVIHDKQIYDEETENFINYQEEETLITRVISLSDSDIDNLFLAIKDSISTGLTRTEREKVAHELSHLAYVRTDLISDENNVPTNLTIWGLQPNEWEIV